MKDKHDEILNTDKNEVKEETVPEESEKSNGAKDTVDFEELLEKPATDEVQNNTETDKKEEKEKKEEISASEPAETERSKHDEAVFLVEKARVIVTDAENQLDECKLLLSSDLEAYEEAKTSLENNGLASSEALLERLGHKVEDHSDAEKEMVVFEPKEALAPIRIQNVSSGAFTGFILSLIAGFATLVGMVYLATEKLKMTLDVSHVPSTESINAIMQWYASLAGMGDNPPAGGSIIVLAVLIVMWIVYKIRVSIKANSNLHMAKIQLQDAEAYSEQKGTCKEEMDKVDAYIKESIDTLKLYQVMLNEQKSKLERILHIEEEKIETASFHNKSKVEISDTMDLIAAIKNFMSVPMSQEGKLSEKSTHLLTTAKNSINKVLERLY